MAVFDYVSLKLARGGAARTAFAKRVADSPLAAGGKVAGLFVAQLGWEAAEAALLAERPGEGRNRDLDKLLASPEVESWTPIVLTPTIRPKAGDQLKPGGIYVHRVFEVESSSLKEFVDLSGQAWPSFETQFDAQIFGLFEATPAPEGRKRLLLLTRYGSHGVWEDSRDPTTEAMKTFMRRQQLTLSTRAASTLLVAPASPAPADAASAAAAAAEPATPGAPSGPAETDRG